MGQESYWHFFLCLYQILSYQSIYDFLIRQEDDDNNDNDDDDGNDISFLLTKYSSDHVVACSKFWLEGHSSSSVD